MNSRGVTLPYKIDIDVEEGSINDGFDDEDYYNDAAELCDDAAELCDDAATQMRPTSKTAIKGLEKMIIDEKFGKLRQCVVCLEELSNGSVARSLPCSHLYHPDYIVKWIKNSNMCPVCHHEMPVVDLDLNSPLCC